MQRLQAFKYELMPDGAQLRSMRQFAGACRYVYNRALALQQANREAGGKFIGYVALAKHLTAWRNDPATPWLKDAPVHAQQHALKDLDRAYKNFFDKRAKFPRFKKKGSGESFRYPDPKQFRLDQANARICLPKLGWMRLRLSRPVLGELRNVTVSESCGKWFVSIQTQREVADPIPTGTCAVGVDMGVARFATLSDGTFLAPLASFKRHEQRLGRYQRRMARKVRGSCNWRKARTRVQRVHADVANARRDFLHKASTALASQYALVCLEDLAVRNMTASAAGTVDSPGRRVRQKAGLNRAILDQGWAEFRRQLEYKLAWRGGVLLTVPPHHTSQTCPSCGHVSAQNRRTQSRFQCVACGHADHADVVGAINVLERGLRSTACGEEGSGRGRKNPAQPTEWRGSEAGGRVRALAGGPGDLQARATGRARLGRHRGAGARWLAGPGAVRGSWRTGAGLLRGQPGVSRCQPEVGHRPRSASQSNDATPARRNSQTAETLALGISPNTLFPGQGDRLACAAGRHETPLGAAAIRPSL